MQICVRNDRWSSASIAQLGERKTEDLKAPCSIHGRSIRFASLKVDCTVVVHKKKRVCVLDAYVLQYNHSMGIC